MQNSIWVNSHNSFLSSSINIDAYTTYCRDVGFKWAAITDRNTTRGIYQFAKQCEQKKLRPIIGVELNINNLHFLLIARNNRGLGRLLIITSKLNTRVSDYKKLEQSSHELGLLGDNNDLIAFSLRKRLPKSEKIILEKTFPNIFFNESEKFPNLCSFSRINSLQGKFIIQILAAIAACEKQTIDYRANIAKDINNEHEEHNVYFECFYNDNLILEELVNKIHVDAIETMQYFVDSTNSNQANQRLGRLAKIGLRSRLKIVPEDKHKAYWTQLLHELSVILDANMALYILIVHDYCRFMMSKKILYGPGRGSATGSLVCFCLFVTHLDPILHELSFERFLCRKQSKLPDIDIDVPSEQRPIVLAHLLHAYPHFAVAQISTVTKMTSKTALKSLLMVVKNNVQNSDILIKELYHQINTYQWRNSSLTELEITQLIVSSQKYQELTSGHHPNHQFWKFIQTIWPTLTNIPRNQSTHASGLVICPNIALNERIGVTLLAQQQINTQFTMHDLAALHYPKFDLLGLSTLSIIRKCLLKIVDNHGKIIKLYNIPTNDPLVMKKIGSETTFGLFQLESTDVEVLIHKFKPTTLAELALLISIYRPGVFKIREKILQRRTHGWKCTNSDSEQEAKITQSTYGLLIYQEQISQLISCALRISNVDAEGLRRQLQHSKEDKISDVKIQFMKIGIKQGIAHDKIVKTFAKINRFANYAFNKSHATAYALICYWTAYLKYKYPFEFAQTLCEHNSFEIIKLQKIIVLLRRANFEICLPKLYVSTTTLVKRGQKIFMPWWVVGQLNRPSVILLSKLIHNNNEQTIVTFFRAIVKTLSKQQCVAIISIGALDQFCYSRSTLLTWLSRIYSWCQFTHPTLPFPLSKPDIHPYQATIHEKQLEKNFLNIWINE